MAYLVSATNHAKLQNPQPGSVYVSWYTPDVLMYCQITGSPAVGTTSLSYGSGVGAGFGEIEADYTIVIETAIGAADIDVIRLRSITGSVSSGTLIVAENNIAWQAGWYLRILRVVDFWPVFPYIGYDGTFYKDRATTYEQANNPNKTPGPVVVFGTHQAKWMVGGGATFDIDLSSSYVMTPGATITLYEMTVWPTPGSTSFNASTGTGTFTAEASGAYYVRFRITDSNGKQQAAYMVCFAHDEGYLPSSMPLKKKLTNSWRRPGWSTSFTLYNVSPPRRNALFVLWHDFPNVPSLRSGSKNILAVGYVRDTKAKLVEKNDITEIDVAVSDIVTVLGRHRGLNVSLNGRANPARWWEFAKNLLTAGRAIHHLFLWHSTLLKIVSFYGLADNTLLAQNIDFEKSNMYDQANSIAWRYGIVNRIVGNFVGELRMEKEAQYLGQTDRNALAEVMAIVKRDRRGEITYDVEFEREVGLVHVSGYSYDGATATPLISIAPGRSPEWIGSGQEDMQRQILQSQTLTNELAGRVLATLNNDLKAVRVPLVGAYQDVLDIVPQRWVYVTEADAGDFTDTTRFFVREIALDIDGGAGIIKTDIVVEKEADERGATGITGDYPSKPVPDASGGAATAWPEPINFPVEEVVPEETETLGGLLAWASCQYRDKNDPAWTDLSGSITGDIGGDVFVKWREIQGDSNPDKLMLLRLLPQDLYISWDFGQTWTSIWPAGYLDLPNTFDDDPAPVWADITALQVVVDYFSSTFYVLIEWQNAANEWRSGIIKYTDFEPAFFAIAGDTALEGYAYPSSYKDYVESPISVPGGKLNYMDSVSHMLGGYDSLYSEVVQQNNNGYVEVSLVFNEVYENVTVISAYLQIDYVQNNNLTLRFSYRANDTDDWTFAGEVQYQNSDSAGPWRWQTHVLAGVTVKEIKLRWRTTLNPFEKTNRARVDYVRINGVPPAYRSIRMALDKQDGSTLWVSKHNYEADELIIDKIDTATMGLVEAYIMGSATEAQVESGERRAVPVTTYGNKDYCAVFGLMALPQGLGSAETNLIYTDDGGDTWNLIQQDWPYDQTIMAAYLKNLSGIGTPAILAARRIPTALLDHNFQETSMGWTGEGVEWMNATGSPQVGCLFTTHSGAMPHVVSYDFGFDYIAAPGDDLVFRYRLVSTGAGTITLTDSVSDMTITWTPAGADDTGWVTITRNVTPGQVVSGITFVHKDDTGSATYTLYLDSITFGQDGVMLYEGATELSPLYFLPVDSMTPDDIDMSSVGMLAVAGQRGSAYACYKGYGIEWADISQAGTGQTKAVRWT